MIDLIVIGGGPAGMTAAIYAAKNGKNVLLLEKNEKLGKKLFISGKGRCNITNNCDTEDIFKNIMRNPKFLMSAIYSFPNYMVVDMFEGAGVKTKVERGERIFPQSDKSSDVISALKRLMEQSGARYLLNKKVTSVTKNGEIFTVKTTGGSYQSKNVLIATGGASYTKTGSTGDGYNFAKALGHSVKNIMPSLVPLEEKGDICSKLQGLSLKNVTFSLYENGKKIYGDLGEMLFTHFGLSGPLVLSASAKLSGKNFENVKGVIDLKPALSAEKLDARLLRDFEENKNKQIKNIMGGIVPSKLAPVILDYAGIDGDIQVNNITKQQRTALGESLKNFTIEIKGFRPIEEAIVTRGGINTKEINPSTMESKLVSGLYFAGEVMDVDALTGGFNLQIAFSSGYLAGSSAN